MKIDKPRLRNALKKMRRVPFDHTDPINVAMAPQEMLDYLAMLAGLKLVCLVGRGFDDPDWVAGVERLAREMRLQVVNGLEWDAEPEHAGLPDWYSDVAPTDPSPRQVVYICKSQAVAREVRAVCDMGKIAMEDEARLLGYPPCCVRDHYRRNRMFDEALMLMFQRISGGDEEEMKRIVREDVGVSPETEWEKSLLAEATVHRPAPFTSVNMCASCSYGSGNGTPWTITG